MKEINLISKVVIGVSHSYSFSARHPVLAIQSISFNDSTVRLQAHGVVTAAHCPSCNMTSSQAHDRYQRQPLDLPWRGWSVRLTLTIRRFRCSNSQCSRATFAEDFGAFLPRWAHRTAAATQALLHLA